MTANGKGVEFRDYMRVVFARGWWIMFVTLGFVGAVFYYSFHFAHKTYVAENEILVTNKFTGSLAKDMATGPDWTKRVRQAELDLKRSVPARRTIVDASESIGLMLGEAPLAKMVEDFKDNLKVTYYKDGDFLALHYAASDRKLAAAVLSLFIKRMIASCVETQVGELNEEVKILGVLRSGLAAEVAEAEKRLDAMKTVAPELRLSAATMALLGSGAKIAALPGTDQAVAVYLELQRDIIMLDSTIADLCEQISLVHARIDQEPLSAPTQRKLETMPAVREATRKRDKLRLELAGLLVNSTARHPRVKAIQAELKGLDAFLSSAAMEATVEIVYEANRKRADLQVKLADLENEVGGLQKRRAKMEENAADWRAKLDEMPSELREVREATLDYEKKAQNLSLITDRLVQAQIKRSLQLNEVGAYYRPQWNRTQVPSRYEKPKHLVHMALGLVLGVVASVFIVYAMEFADHSVKDVRDIRVYSKAAVIGVISDYNQLKAVAYRAARVKASGLKRYALGVLFIVCVVVLGWAYWRNLPRPAPREELPANLSAATVCSIDQAMEMYAGSSADFEAYRVVREPELEVVPAVGVPEDMTPLPALSE